MICCWPPGQQSVGGAATVAKSVFGQQQQHHGTCNMLHGNALCRKTTRRQLELFLVTIFFLFRSSHLLLPLCRHIPKAKATAIADTPELKRIAENTKIQSNVKYHADFEKAKGKFTQVSMQRTPSPQPPIPASLSHTHASLFMCRQVADDPETLRIKQNTKHISNVAYHGDLEKKAAMEKQRGSAEVSDSSSE